MKKILLLGYFFLFSMMVYSQDVWLQNHFSPNSGFRLSNAENVTVLVNNNSGVIMASNTITVKYQVDNGTVVSQLLSSNLTAGASWNFTFTTKADLSAFGAHIIKVWVERPGDVNSLNNELTWTVNNTCIEMNQPANVSVCNGINTSIINFTSNLSNVGYTWTNSNPAIGLSASGFDGIPSFTAVNTGTSPITSTITVRPHYSVSQTFNYTGAMQTFVVPQGITKIKIDARGAQGQSAIYNQPGTKPDDLGGKGGRVIAEYPVTPGQTIYIMVGGSNGYNGGGTGGGSIAQPNGGGASDIRIGGNALANRVIVAGGGGGGGNNCSNNPEPGGAGGELIGAFGWQCGNQTGTAVGQGGTQTEGGAAGTSPATAGILGIGGNAGGQGTASGGGGGGYYGGGGAAYGGGGGGSSYTDALAISVQHTQGFQDNDGQIMISYFNDECGAAYDKTFVYTINPTPTVVIPTDQNVLAGVKTKAVNFSSPTTGGNITYEWTNDMPAIGLAASGTGNIPAFVVNNNTNAPLTANITVTPKFTDGFSATSCNGVPQTFKITAKALMPDANGIIYVKKGSNGTGESWASPIAELADALVAAKNLNAVTPAKVKQVWVASGTYQPMYSPEDGNNFGIDNGRDNAFLLVKDVKVYGGFAGNETTLQQRDLSIVANHSILSGDFNNDDVVTGSGATLSFAGNGENAYHVLLSVGNVGTAELNGFVVSGGNGNGSNVKVSTLSIQQKDGAGMNITASSPIVANCIIQYNHVQTGLGGAIYIGTPNGAITAAPIISNSKFLNNRSTNFPGQGWGDEGAGAMYNVNSNPTITDCSFIGNLVTGGRFGGAIVNLYSEVQFNNVTISNNASLGTSGGAGGLANLGNKTVILNNVILTGNSAGANGGAIFNSSGAVSVLNNVLVSGNVANNGAAIYNSNSSPILTNVTISGNQANVNGTIYNTNTSLPQLQNTVVFGNSSGIVNNSGADVPVYRNSLVQDANGAGLIAFNGTATDLFISPLSPALSTAGDYRPKVGSAMINAGDQTLFAGLNASTKDLDGNLRLVGSNIDLGPYEATIQSQTITATNLSKTYGNADFEPGATASSGLTVSYLSADNNIAEAYQDASDSNKWKLKIKKAGTVNITASQAGGNGYSAAPDQVFVLTIQPKVLTISATGNHKVYDAATIATVNLSSDALTGDVLSLAYTSAAFNTENVGNNIPVTVNGITISGASAANYTFNTTASATANITPFALTVSAVGNDRAYNATNVATVNLSSNAFAGDNLTLGYALATFNDKNVANGKPISVSGISLSGTDAGNYTFNATTSTTANITPFALTVSATGNHKIYDAANNATVNLSSNAFAGDNLILNYTAATFNDKTVANGKTVSVSGISLSGTDAGNYTFNTTTSTSANITPFALTISVTANSRVYNATNNATVNLSNNAFAGDNITVAYTSATFNNKTVANNKPVSVSGISLSGTDAGNYTFNTTANATANITPFALTILANANNKVYNGNADATASLSHNGFVGDALALNYTAASFDNRNVGNGKTVSVSGISLSGIDAGNYTFNATTTATAAITPATLNIVAQAKAKTYGDTDPALTYTSTGLVGSDALAGSLTRAAGENVNTYAITQGTLSAGTNYIVTFTGANLSISKANLTVTAANAARCFGQTNPSFALNYNGFKLNDNDNSLTSKPQAITSATASSAAGNYPITVSGGSSANYTLLYTNGTLRIDALPNVSITPSRTGAIGKGLTLQLMASGGTSYSWANAQGIISGQNSANLTIRPSTNTTYTVTVTNANGCSSTASYAVIVADDLSILSATNILSPNGDGVNDVWKVDNLDLYPQAVVRIFDKAGRIVYTKKGYDNTWDGTYNGQPLAENTYYYIIDLEAGKVLRGYITLVRDR